jgi:hypothetical protein
MRKVAILSVSEIARYLLHSTYVGLAGD